MAVFALLIGVWSWAQELKSRSAGPAKDPAATLFLEQIRPVLGKQCLMCHGGQAKESGLDLSTREGLLRGGDSGPGVVPGNAKASLVYKLITHEQQPGMPFKADKLPEEVIAQIGDWINAGAPYVESLKLGATSSGQASMPHSLSATAQPSKDAGMALFVQQIRPVLETQCLKCHGGGQVKRSGLDLSSREGLLRGGDTGPVVVPGDAQSSLLYKRVKHEVQPGMPFQGDKLSEDVIARIAEWINAGARYDQPLKLSSAGQPVATEPGGNHWAFKPPKRPSVPAVKNRAWVRNPIDAFIAAEHEKRGLKPMPQAEKSALLRRVYLDLIGLPPTPEELQVFLADRSSNAYEKVVDRLLQSPLYGERWGRHWMDIWRYSDWFGSGDQVRNSQPNIWNWRDWIVESLNQDRGYDQMIQEMLAGDEIAPTDPKTLRATGYLARNWYRFNRNVWLQDVVEHTATGFLGITLKCARCHDHKFDPIAQEEYYRFRAFFESYDVRMDRIPGQPDLKENNGVFTNGLPRAYDAEPREPTTMAPYLPGIFAQTFRFIRGDERNPDKDHPLTPGVPEILGNKGIEIRGISLPIEAAYPDLRPFVHEDLLAQAQAEIDKARTSLENAKKELVLARHQVDESEIRESRISATHASAASSSGGPDTLEPSTGIRSPEAGLAGAQVSFDKDIKPILERNCFSCHDANNGKSELILETVDLILQGGNLSGPAVIPRRSRASPLVQYLRGEKNPRMPLGGQPLPQEEIGLIARWIDHLPEEDPQVALRKAEAAVALAERELAARQACLPALEARIAADKAKYGDPPDPKAESLTLAARKAEGRAQILKCEENLLRAQQKLAEVSRLPAPTDEKEEKVREKRIEATRKDLDAAVAALKEAGEGYTPIGKLYPKTSTGRRLALARWIANKENPLTARVAVNHIWLRHFGKALVPTVTNFGLNGRPPTHPELLDWLAKEFMDKNWSMKSLHRLIVTSNTYQMRSSAMDAKHPNLSIDPENHYLWRMNPRRMEAELVRDSLLQVAGELDLTQGGPELDEKAGLTSRRRSLYFRSTPDTQMVFLKLFDAANPSECYERNESVAPQQALALTNSPLSYRLARQLSLKISQKVPSKAGESEFVKAAFERVVGRPPSAKELAESTSFIQEQESLFERPEELTAFNTGRAGEIPPSTNPHLRARESFMHALFNHNDFVTIR